MSYVTDPKFIVGAIVGIALWVFVIPMVRGMVGGKGGRGQGDY